MSGGNGATRWDVLVELLPLLNTALLVGRYLMPRARRPHVPDSTSSAEYPQWFSEWATGQEVDRGVMQWLRDYPAEDVKELILGVLSSGGAVFISQTRDGGALGVTIMFGDAKKRTYVSSPEELDIIVTKVAQTVIS